ncbi:UNVERIFIED_CONTAM: hypothetical protein FKN15_016034 [Acipenser sinensis]
MSRRSLRLTTGHYSDDSYLDTNNSSISYSGKYKESRSRKQNRSTSKQSALLSQPPRNAASNSSLTHTSFHSCASDMSLMSTMLQESSIQERTVMDSFWGLDEDGDLKDATAMMANGDITSAETQTTVINGYTCNECTMLSDRKDALTAYCTSNTASSTAEYSRDKGKKSSLWYFGPASWLSLLPVLSRSEMQASLEDTTSSTPVEESVATGNAQPSTESPRHASQSGAHFFDSGRMVDLERQLALLSDRCDRSSQQYDERHGRVVELFHQLQEQVAQMSNNEGMSAWISNLFNQHMSSTRELRGEGTGQPQNEFLMLHQGHESRILELEKLLQIIAAKTEEQKHKYTKATTFGGQSEDQNYLLSEVKRLELELHQIKTDLLRVQSSPPGCEGLASVRETFVRQSDLQGLLMEMEMKILKNITMYKSKTKLMPTAEVVTHAVHNAGAAGMTEEQVRVIVTNALRLYSQDQTGLVDYALESGGGSILSTRCSETYETKTALMSLFGIPLWYFSQSPRVIIQPDVHPGNCWAFKGSQGYLVIRLSLSVYPTSFSLEHIPKSLSPTGSINSAPKDFTVYGLEDEYQEEGKLLGRYIYNEDGDSLQTFPIQEENDKAYQIIEMRVLSNWGHPEYTCLYRFRVHGEPRLE